MEKTNLIKRKVGVLSLSGGMDSTSLLLHLLAEGAHPYAVSFDYGQKHNIELERVKKNIEYLASKGYMIPHTVVDISILGKLYNSALTNPNVEVPEGHYAEENMKSTVVPNRNAIFSSMVYGYALSLSTELNQDTFISLGIHSGDHQIYPDCRQEFRDALNYAFKIGNWGSERVDYYTPYLKGDKFTILEDAKINCEKLNLDFNIILANTNTCYNPNEKGESCGKCGSCQERLLAFNKLGSKDPVTYSSDYTQLIENVLQSEIDFQNKK